jgi:hypothetical protein
MIRAFCIPETNSVVFPIPNNYIGKELEVIIFPVNEPSERLREKAKNVDSSFGGWADMDKSTEEICSELRNSRAFRKREITL